MPPETGLRACRDEATASCDAVTDAKISAVIRRVFEHCTVLTIAHRCANSICNTSMTDVLRDSRHARRLNTVADSDRIMVIKEGVVAELDTPAKLLADEASQYSVLMRESAA